MEESDGKQIHMVSRGGSPFNFARVLQDKWGVNPTAHMTNCCILQFHYENDQFYIEEVVHHDFSGWEDKIEK